MKKYLSHVVFALLLVSACQAQQITSPKLILKRDAKTSLYAYFDDQGHKVLGDYRAAYTDTLTEYGIVADPDFVVIDRTGKHIYKFYRYDNGPDYLSEGTYRIVKNDKIGFIDSATAKILIEPKFDCAFPFENGKAKVSFKCKTVKSFPGDEHSTWVSDDWFYIDKTGKIVASAK